MYFSAVLDHTRMDSIELITFFFLSLWKSCLHFGYGGAVGVPSMIPSLLFNDGYIFWFSRPAYMLQLGGRGLMRAGP